MTVNRLVKAADYELLALHFSSANVALFTNILIYLQCFDGISSHLLSNYTYTPCIYLSLADKTIMKSDIRYLIIWLSWKNYASTSDLHN